MDCPICQDPIPVKARDSHLLIAERFADQHVHVHGNLDDTQKMRHLIDVAEQEIGIVRHSQKLDLKEVVFRNRMRIGDILVMTCGIRDLKKAFPDLKINVSTVAMHIWDHNPYIDPDLMMTPENMVKIGPSWLTNASNWLDWHFCNAYRVSIEKTLGVSIPQGESRPDIWLTREEYEAPRVFNDPYWIIVTGGERMWGCKSYPFERWQEFINQNKDLLFVQLGATKDDPPRLQGPNVIDYVGKTEDKKTGIRDLFKLFLNAEGSVGLVSFHTHLSGALYKPAVIVAGAREPLGFTQYPNHRILATDGAVNCGITACWKCKSLACRNILKKNNREVPQALAEKILKDDPQDKPTPDELKLYYEIVDGWVPKCVDIIDPEDLTRAINSFYKGGRLVKGKVCAKPKLKNIVPTPEKIVIPEVDIGKYGMQWGGGCITESDWEFMHWVIKKHNIKTVLEFGSGLSTLLMNDLGLKVVTYETSQAWINKLLKINPNLDIRLWDGKDKPELAFGADMAFVDGPAGGSNRELSTEIAALVADVVIVHDANREYERKWQELYLKSAFKGPQKGGNRCHLWEKTAKTAPTPPEMPVLPAKPPQGEAISVQKGIATGKSIKIVSTARGWGGCARSVTTIMRHLLAAGHKVEFIPFRNDVGSKEYQQFLNLHPDITVSESYATLSEPCDVLFMYADDYIWEFGKPEIVQAFSDLHATRKIMMLNYRRGKVGELPWTQGWGKYMFLNSTQEAELLKELQVQPGVKTKVLPPCTELEEFFKVQPDYNKSIRLVRHSSQGDTKFAENFAQELDTILTTRVDLQIHMLPGPTFVRENDKVRKYPRTDKVSDLVDFLRRGNLFWYSLPSGYMDQGPRVVLEAMAAGLPVLADNWGGVKDRITPETGWLCDTKEEMVAIVKNLTFEELKAKGEAARERARREFIPQKWLEEILT